MRSMDPYSALVSSYLLHIQSTLTFSTPPHSLSLPLSLPLSFSLSVIFFSYHLFISYKRRNPSSFKIELHISFGYDDQSLVTGPSDLQTDEFLLSEPTILMRMRCKIYSLFFSLIYRVLISQLHNLLFVINE